MIRAATLADVDALAALELRCFDSDRLSRRSFRHLLKRGNASLLVDEEDGRLRGYSLVLYHRGSSIARLYSFAVDPDLRRRGIARALLEASEQDARERRAITLRLEVRVDNGAAVRFYEAAGYRRFGTYTDYYEDHADAVRFEKRLASKLPADLSPVPYYAQTLDFTCGPACLMMAMRALDPGLETDRTLELRLWREATTVFMTSGHGGCGPLGLALAAWHRGFAVTVQVSDETGLFVDSVRSEDKKEVIRLVSEDFLQEIRETDIALSHEPPGLDDLQARFEQGSVPVVLVSSWRLTGDKAPHWVVITGFDAAYVYLHEPYVDVDEGETETVCMGIPIARGDFERMMRYGRNRQYAAVILSRRDVP